MKFSSALAVLAAGLASGVAAHGDAVDDDIETTIRMTTVKYMTVTVIDCDAAVTDCPNRKNSSATALYPAGNGTAWAKPTGGYEGGSYGSYSSPSPSPIGKSTGTTGSSRATAVASAAAEGLIVQTGLVLGLLGAGVVLLA